MKYPVGGEYRHNLDSRKRLFIPASIRSSDALGTKLVIARDVSDGQKCLGLYSAEGWDARVDRFLEIWGKDEESRQNVMTKLHRDLIAVELDDQGRVVLTKQLLKYSSIEKETVIVGAGDHALIWNAELYDKLREEEDDLEDLLALYRKPLS